MGQVYQPPAKSPCLKQHLHGESAMFPFLPSSFFPFRWVSFSSLLFPFPTHIYVPLLFLRWVDEVCEETVDKYISNECQCKLNLSHVPAGFLLSPQMVPERGCCSVDCAKATVVAAKVKQKGSRKTFANTKSLKKSQPNCCMLAMRIPVRLANSNRRPDYKRLRPRSANKQQL